MASLNPMQGTLGIQKAAYLLRRCSYRFTKAKVNTLANKTAIQAATSLISHSPLQMDQPVYDDSAYGMDNFEWILPTGIALPSGFTPDLRPYVQCWWLNEALNDPGIVHRMMFFLHQHMVVDIFSYGSQHFYDYLSLLRWASLGNFKKLAMKMVMDNCMLLYLNNHQNTKNNPNENFAREFFELFTIGKGPQIGPGDYTNYTEDDIVQAAKVFTGFRIRGQRDQVDPDTNIPRGQISTSLHHTGNKTFSAKFQGTTIVGGTTTTAITAELQSFVDMVFAQEEVSRNFCRRLYRYFVGKNITPEIETDIIEPLAAYMRLANYEMAPVLLKLLASEHFYDVDDANTGDDVLGGLIKSPLELLLQSLSFFNLTIPDPLSDTYNHYNRFWRQAVIDRILTLGGMPLFLPSNVAGYPPYYQEPDFHHQWFNSSTIISRYKLPAILLTGKRQIGGSPNTTTGVKLDIAPWLRDSGFCSDPSDPYVLVQELLLYLFPLSVDNDRLEYFYNTVFLNNLPPDDWTYEWENYINTGNATEVKIALERLITAIMYSPEFQTM